ncbi:MAG: FHA domain-containing protein [Verrucomicrobiota bacterium]|jgi:pSer/pThr/pTyr-binding forkhead associated (FHA) protein
MVQLQIQSGNRTGTTFQSARFPIRAGRSQDSDLALDDAGVWPRHFQIDWRQDGLIVEVEPDALLSVNGTPVRRALLRNGDVLTLGAVKIRFGLSPVRLSSLAAREWLTWIALGALCLGQVALVYALLP